MCQHAGILNQLEGLFEDALLRVDEEQPGEGREYLGIAEGFADELLEFEFLEGLFELHMERYQKAYSTQRVIQIFLRVRIRDSDSPQEVFQHDDEVVGLAISKELVQRQSYASHFFSLNDISSTLRLKTTWLFSAMKKAQRKTVLSLSLGI